MKYLKWILAVLLIFLVGCVVLPGNPSKGEYRDRFEDLK
jgi:hypothetical protein